MGTFFLSDSEILLDYVVRAASLPSCPLGATKIWSLTTTVGGASDWLLIPLVEGTSERWQPALHLYFLQSMSAGLDSHAGLASAS
jgi:hypothetical protein